MYYNPVKVVETNDWREECSKFQEILGIHKPLIITSNGNLERQKLSTFFNPNLIFSNITPNPTFESCQKAINFSQTYKFDGVIAIGGGSVMDTAKTVMAALGTSLNDIKDLIEVETPYKNQVPAIFMPTTHGTGSEVTKWGTILDMKEKKKYSISQPDLFPDVAILDGSLCISLPLGISLTTVLDALSHCFEAIWNKNANTRSTEYAIDAICLILCNVEEMKKEPQNTEIRNKILRASNIAGLAFSNTKTAAAHSISYPLTVNFNIPHGIAASLPLIPLLKLNKCAIENYLNRILKKLNLKKLSELEERIREIPDGVIKYSLKEWGIKANQLDELISQSFTKGRMDNNIVDLSKKDVYQIMKSIF